MPHLQLSADERTLTGNGPSRRLRKTGQVPGVVYQPGQPSIAFALPDRELRRVLLGQGGRTSVIDLRVGEAPARSVIFKEWQIHPVRADILHVDFQEVDLTEAIETQIHIALEGNAIGVREGGVLDQMLWEVTVRALPDALPDRIPHDVSQMAVGDALTVADLVAPEGSQIIAADPEAVVASVSYARVAEEPEEEGLEGAAEGEPEIVGDEAEETDERE